MLAVTQLEKHRATTVTLNTAQTLQTYSNKDNEYTNTPTENKHDFHTQIKTAFTGECKWSATIYLSVAAKRH